MSNVSDKLLQANREKASNKPREIFARAFEVWCRDTGKLLSEATEFRDIADLLAELQICYAVGDALCGHGDKELDDVGDQTP
jgi:hypothetical protein